MSLAVPPGLLEQARRGEVDDEAFLECVRTSLPYAWAVVTGLIADLRAGGADFADNQVSPPGEAARGQLLRLMASDAMRAAIERHYDVRLAFQNCHRAAVFRPGAAEALAEFTSARSQLLNQRPEMVDCLKSGYPERGRVASVTPAAAQGRLRRAGLKPWCAQWPRRSSRTGRRERPPTPRRPR